MTRCGFSPITIRWRGAKSRSSTTASPSPSPARPTSSNIWPAARRNSLQTHRGMRKQYHFRPSSAGLKAWDVDRLLTLAEDLPMLEVPLDAIAELDEAY